MGDKLPNVIELNVGGQLFTTRLATLTSDPDSMLAAMFSGRHLLDKDSQGRFFIDREGALFRHVLNFLRDGSLPAVEVHPAVLKEAQYFQVNALVEALQTSPARHSEDKVRAHLLSRFPKYDEVKQRLVSCAEAEACRSGRIIDVDVRLVVHDEVVSHPQKGMCSVRFSNRILGQMTTKDEGRSWLEQPDVVTVDLCVLDLEEWKLQTPGSGVVRNLMQSICTYMAGDLANEGFKVRHQIFPPCTWCRHGKRMYFKEEEVKFTFSFFPHS